MTSRPVGPEGHCFLFIAFHIGHVKDLTSAVTKPHEWIRTTKIRFFRIYLCEGMSDPGKIICSEK